MRRKIQIKDVVSDPTVLGRVEVNEAVAEEYAETLRLGLNVLPPLDVFETPEGMYLADGSHRLRAYQKVEAAEVPCEVRKGLLSDARWFAAQANLRHGLRPSPDDKRRAVENLLRDPHYASATDAKIALQCGVSAPIVGKVRRALYPEPDPDGNGQPVAPAPRIVTDKRGRKLNVARIGGKGGRPVAALRAARAAEVLKDGTGAVVPDCLRPVAEEAALLDELMTHVSGVGPRLDRIRGTSAVTFLDPEAVMLHVKAIRDLARAARFHRVCVYCSGAGCAECGGRGWHPAGAGNGAQLKT